MISEAIRAKKAIRGGCRAGRAGVAAGALTCHPCAHSSALLPTFVSYSELGGKKRRGKP